MWLKNGFKSHHGSAKWKQAPIKHKSKKCREWWILLYKVPYKKNVFFLAVEHLISEKQNKESEDLQETPLQKNVTKFL